jgi:hypothetical protein
MVRIAAFLVGVFVLVLLLDLISQFSYQRKSIREIKSRLNRTLVRVFALSVVLFASTGFWNYMGWKQGQPIHLPWW